MREKPVILASEEVARSRIFRVEQLQLRFSNGVERTYERLRGKAGGLGAVMIVAMLDAENVVLVEEYCAGSEAYELSLKANPANVYVMNNYAYYHSELNIELKKAELMSAKTVEKEPSNSTYLDTYAWIFYMQGNYSLAKFYIERAVDNLKPDYDAAVIYDHYGDILWKTNNTEKAKEMWIKALEKGIDTPEIKQKIEKGIL